MFEIIYRVCMNLSYDLLILLVLFAMYFGLPIVLLACGYGSYVKPTRLYHHVWNFFIYVVAITVSISTFGMFHESALRPRLVSSLRTPFQTSPSVFDEREVLNTDPSYIVRRYEIVGYKPPMNMYVSLRDVESGRIYSDVRVAKHCSNPSVTIGQLVNLKSKYVTYKDSPNVVYSDFSGLQEAFCE